jgi:hypothetical protein
MSGNFDPEITWDGRMLSGWAVVDGDRVQFRATRGMIRSIPIYSDLMDWEIERHKVAIFERLREALLSKTA